MILTVFVVIFYMFINVNLEYCNNKVLRVGSQFPLNNKYIIYPNNNVYLNAIFVLTFLKC